MAKKLTKKQAEKLATIKTYLDHMEAGNCLLIDSDATNVYKVENIWQNAAGIFVSGKSALFRPCKERLYDGTELNEIYRKCMKDEDFAAFVKTMS